jgi:hypothetical protein
MCVVFKLAHFHSSLSLPGTQAMKMKMNAYVLIWFALQGPSIGG